MIIFTYLVAKKVLQHIMWNDINRCYLLNPVLLSRYWLCAATGPSIKVWDLESKNMVEELRPEVPGSARAEPPQCLSLAWSADGQTLFAGYSDSMVRVWQVEFQRFLKIII